MINFIQWLQTFLMTDTKDSVKSKPDKKVKKAHKKVDKKRRK